MVIINKRPGKPLIALHIFCAGVEMATLFMKTSSRVLFGETLT
jgi:hypothetical protein